jgi:hypothetical protein
MMPPFSSSMGGAGRFPGQFAPGQLYPPIKA